MSPTLLIAVLLTLAPTTSPQADPAAGVEYDVADLLVEIPDYDVADMGLGERPAGGGGKDDDDEYDAARQRLADDLIRRVRTAAGVGAEIPMSVENRTLRAEAD